MTEYANTLQTNTIAHFVDLIGEGEIGGPAVAGDIYKSTYFNDIPVHNPDGSANFNGVTLEFRPGTHDQAYIEGFNAVVNTVAVETLVLYGHPISKTIADPNVDHCKVTLSVAAIMNQDKYGDLVGAQFDFSISVTPDNGSGVKQQVVNLNVHEKTTSETRLQYALNNLSQYGSAPWVITVERLSPDSTSLTYVNAFSWHSYTKVIDTKLNYSDRVVVASVYDAKEFGNSAPTRAWRLNGRKIKIPSNYDPVARTYSGDWDGTFTIAVTNNPAWIVYDLLTDPVVGLGDIISDDMVDKWALYSCAQYNDFRVPSKINVRQPDGSYTPASDTEPRFSFNGVLQARNQGLETVAHVCGSMNAFPIWAAGQVSFVQDRPITTPVRPVGLSNVSEDGFQYSGVPKRNRHTVVKVSYNNPDLLGRLDVIELVDDQAVIEFGYNELEFAAIGCYSKTEAIRKGRHALDTDVRASETVSFSGGLEWADAIPGELMMVQDPNYAAVTMEGRVKSGTTTSLVLDKELAAMDPGQTYTMFLQTATGGGVERILIPSVVASDTLTWSVPLAAPPFTGAVLVISASNLEARPFMLLTAEEVDGFYNVTGIQYDPDKWDRIEYGIITDEPIYTALLPNLLLPPTNIDVVGYTYAIGEGAVRMRGVSVSWTASIDPRVAYYEFEMASSLGERNKGTTLITSVDWRNAGEGTYNVRVRAVGIGLYSEWLTYGGFELAIDFAELEPKTVLETATADVLAALEWLDEWGADGKFTVLEKTSFREGWLIRTVEFLELKAQAETFSIDPALIAVFVSTFDDWGTYLNAGVEWTPPDTYPPLDSSLPLWIQTAQLPVTVDIDRVEFNGKAEGYFTALVNLKYAVSITTYDKIMAAQALADAAMDDAAEALSNIGGWAVDGYFQPVEKVSMNAGWIVRTEEYLAIEAQADALGVTITPLTNALNAWGTYLNGGVAWTVPAAVSDATMPSWIKQANLTTEQVIVRSEFVGVAEVYFAALTAVKIALSIQTNTNIETAQATADAAAADASSALGFLDEWAADGKFTVNEKRQMQDGWYIRTAEFLEVKAQAENREISTVAFVAAFASWGTYLNGGTAWTPPASYPPADGSLPLWIQNAQLAVTVDIDRTVFVSTASSYFGALVTIKTAIAGGIDADIDTAITTADAAAADAATALGYLDDWASDGQFTPVEKQSFKSGWFVRLEEYFSVIAQATSLSVSTTNLVLYFDAWGTYLNGGAAWEPPSSYSTSETYVPAWLKTAAITTTTAITRATFVTNASTYFNELVAVRGLISTKLNDNTSTAADTANTANTNANTAVADAATALSVANAAQTDADTAISYLGDWASDSKFSPEEKKSFKSGWFSRIAEYIEIKAQAVSLSISTTNLVSTFTAWGTYLNGGTAYTPPTSYSTSETYVPAWIKTASIPVTTTIVRTTFVTNANNYFAELVAIKGLISAKLNSNTTTAATTAVWTSISNRPTTLSDLDATAANELDGKATTFYQTSAPSGSVGDLWFDTDASYKMYRHNGSSWIAVQDSAAASAAAAAANSTATTANTTANSASTTANTAITQVATKITTFYTTSTPTATATGDLWYSTTTKLLKRWTGASWVEVSNAFTNTSELTDGAGLGLTATWTSVASRPATLTALNSTDGTRLAGIEAGAQVTSTVRVNAALTNSTLLFGTGKICFGDTYHAIYGSTTTMNFVCNTGNYLTLGDSADTYLRSPRNIFAESTGSGKNLNLICGAYSTDTTGVIDFRTAGTSRFFIKPTGMFPRADGTMYFGYSTNRLKEMWCVDGTINTSDEKEKSLIEPSDLGLDFIASLQPKKWVWNTGVRTHYGLVAQDVEAVMQTNSIDFAGLIKNNLSMVCRDTENTVQSSVVDDYGVLAQTEKTEIETNKIKIETKDIQEGDVCLDSYDSYGLRYHEFIGPMIKAIQQLNDKTIALEGELRTMKGIK